MTLSIIYYVLYAKYTETIPKQEFNTTGDFLADSLFEINISANFSRSSSEMDLITRRVIKQFEGDNVSQETLQKYCDPDSPEYAKMVEEIRKQLHFTTLRFHRLDDMLDSTGLPHDCLCTYCWNGRE